MKTIAKKIYKTPQMDIVLVQNQQALLAGSAYGNVDEREDGGEIGG